MSAMYERECRHRANVARTEPGYPPWRDGDRGLSMAVAGNSRDRR